MKEVLWLSNSWPLAEQIKWLEDNLGEEIELYRDLTPFKSAEEIKLLFEESGCEDLILTAPLAMIRDLIALGIRPLWAQIRNEDQNCTFVRIVEVNFSLEKIEPDRQSNQRKILWYSKKLPSKCEVDELKRWYGNISVVHIDKDNEVEKILNESREEYFAVVVIMPLWKIVCIFRDDMLFLWSQMERTEIFQAHISTSDRDHYRFMGLSQIKNAKIATEYITKGGVRKEY